MADLYSYDGSEEEENEHLLDSHDDDQ